MANKLKKTRKIQNPVSETDPKIYAKHIIYPLTGSFPSQRQNSQYERYALGELQNIERSVLILADGKLYRNVFRFIGKTDKTIGYVYKESWIKTHWLLVQLRFSGLSGIYHGCPIFEEHAKLLGKVAFRNAENQTIII